MGAQLGSGGFAGVCAVGNLDATTFVSPLYECWVRRVCASLVGVRGQKSGETLYPLVAVTPAASVLSYQ